MLLFLCKQILIKWSQTPAIFFPALPHYTILLQQTKINQCIQLSVPITMMMMKN